MPKGKHLTIDDRQSIQLGLNEGLSFKEIALTIGKDASTVSKEVRKHIILKRTGSFNPCEKVKECKHYGDLCSPCNKRYGKTCRSCNVVLCHTVCKSYNTKVCNRLLFAPYVCNGCSDRHGCRLERHLYDAKHAQKVYEETLSTSRQGFAISTHR